MKSIKIYICAAMMALGVSSCDSFLTTPPLDQISEDQWWSDKSQTEMMVKGAYQYVYGPNEVVLRDCISDNATHREAKYKEVGNGTYTTQSANLMLREIGITMFLACVGLSAGDGFVDTIVNKGGFAWIGYGFFITMLPLLVIGLIGRHFFKLNYYTLMGLLAGSTTDPPALAYANATAGNDAPAVGYATVYPLTMFLRVLTAQLMILFFY